LVVESDGSARAGGLGGDEQLKSLQVANPLAQIETTLRANGFSNLPDDISSEDVSLHGPCLLVSAYTAAGDKTVCLSEPWPDNDETRRFLTVFLHMRSLIGDESLHPSQNDIRLWLVAHKPTGNRLRGRLKWIGAVITSLIVGAGLIVAYKRLTQSRTIH
jgi:hypothetical protein